MIFHFKFFGNIDIYFFQAFQNFIRVRGSNCASSKISRLLSLTKIFSGLISLWIISILSCNFWHYGLIRNNVQTVFFNELLFFCQIRTNFLMIPQWRNIWNFLDWQSLSFQTNAFTACKWILQGPTWKAGRRIWPKT